MYCWRRTWSRSQFWLCRYDSAEASILESQPSGMQQLASILQNAEQAGLLDVRLCMIAGSPKPLQSKSKKSSQIPLEDEFLVSVCKWFTLDCEDCKLDEQPISIGGQDFILQVRAGGLVSEKVSPPKPRCLNPLHILHLHAIFICSYLVPCLVLRAGCYDHCTPNSLPKSWRILCAARCCSTEAHLRTIKAITCNVLCCGQAYSHLAITACLPCLQAYMLHTFCTLSWMCLHQHALQLNQSSMLPWCKCSTSAIPSP